MARLDRLPAGKEIAQIGAAIGREFSHALLAAVAAGSDAELEEGLVELTKADLIFARASGAETTFAFKHALIQDAAYGVLLRGPRQALHSRIADALALSFADEVKGRPELLAYHLGASARAREAVPAWRRAAVRTLHRGAWIEGLRQLQAALSAAATLTPDDERDRMELDLQMMVGGVTMGTVGHSAPSAQQAYERAYGLARRLGDAHSRGAGRGKLWIVASGKGGLEGAVNLIPDRLQ